MPDGSTEKLYYIWPENEMTAYLPVPNMKILAVDTTAQNRIIITFENTSIGQFKEYIEEIKENGFNVDIVSSDNNESNSDYSFSAKNGNGYKFSASYLGSSCFIFLQKM